MSESVTAVFSDFSSYIAEEQEHREEIRNKVRDLEQCGRELSAILSRIHSAKGLKTLSTILQEGDDVVSKNVCAKVSNLAASVPKAQYYRFYSSFNFCLQRIVFHVALMYYLKHESLISRETAAQILGMATNAKQENLLLLDLEDYLAGLIQMSNELARFSVNCVTHGDFQRPVKIAAFLSDLLEGFRLLNLKNDTLRKKFDSLKYDMKKVEEVVYDLSIRGLIKADDQDPKEEDKQETKDQETTTEEKVVLTGGQ